MPPRTLPGAGLSGFAPKGDGNWNTWADANWRIISALLQCRVKSVVASVPGAPVNGDMHIVTSGANANAIAIRDNGAWIYIAPQVGWRVFNTANSLLYQFRGDLWVAQTWLGNVVISPDNTAWPSANGEVTFASYANNTLTLLKKGTDGVVRKVDLTLVPA